jgi:NADH:ubiquinone oxidoreductase subunit 3 (subunit A)
LRAFVQGSSRQVKKLRSGGVMKILVELLLCILHPVAVVLMWINLATRTDLSTLNKIAWAIFGIIPLVPFIYVLTGGDLF